ncbi:MAG TPA: hypothetical protein VFQ59_03715 [Candidatus Paceibacterota bacterium]|nr:hypothetical protein [Candidatus Paceibacterota bacterium]
MAKFLILLLVCSGITYPQELSIYPFAVEDEVITETREMPRFYINNNNTNRWEKLNGPMGGWILSLQAFNDTLFAGIGDRGIIYYSTNGGGLWQKANMKLNSRIGGFVKTGENGMYP